MINWQVMKAKEPKARWWHREGERLVCDLCPRECRLSEGQRGFCFVRKNEGGEMVLTTYGRSTGFCIDPIEKKPLSHFLPGTSVLSFGTAGCNLGCRFCQNWDISKSREIEILSAEARPEGIVAAAKAHGCRSIAFTYNDPVIWAEYALDTAREARAAGIRTVAVTAGYISAGARPAFFEGMDAVNVDLKGLTEAFYRKVTIAHLEPVLETLKWLVHESEAWVEITNLVIPGHNDDEDELRRMSDWVARELGSEIPVHFTAFHPDYKMRDVPRTPRETLRTAHRLATEAGLRFVYVGNVADARHESTWCPGCGALLIERRGYDLARFGIVDGACGGCGRGITGVFENEPGTWGSRREPVRIGREGGLPG